MSVHHPDTNESLHRMQIIRDRVHLRKNYPKLKFNQIGRKKNNGIRRFSCVVVDDDGIGSIVWPVNDVRSALYNIHRNYERTSDARQPKHKQPADERKK